MYMIMKKIIAFFIIAVTLTACYDDYILDFEYDGVYFPYQVDVRTFVVGEGMKIKFGAALGGVRDNDRDRTVNYQIDNSLISDATLAAMKGSAASYIKTSVAEVDQLKLMPQNYYTLSDNSKIVIEKGQHSGTVTLKPDSARFLADPMAMSAAYAIPLRITSADADTIIQSRNYAVIAFKYETMLYGNYWHGGITIEKMPQGLS